jgi:hypothetical protein
MSSTSAYWLDSKHGSVQQRAPRHREKNENLSVWIVLGFPVEEIDVSNFGSAQQSKIKRTMS